MLSIKLNSQFPKTEDKTKQNKKTSKYPHLRTWTYSQIIDKSIDSKLICNHLIIKLSFFKQESDSVKNVMLIVMICVSKQYRWVLD